MLFLQKIKRPIYMFILKQKDIYIWVYKTFAKILKTSFLGLFWALPSLSEIFFKNQDSSLFLLHDV